MDVVSNLLETTFGGQSRFRWFHLLDQPNWVVCGGRFECIYARYRNGALVVPSVQIYDVESTRHFTRRSGDHTHHYYRIQNIEP